MKFLVLDLESLNGKDDGSETAPDWIPKKDGDFHPIHCHKICALSMLGLDTDAETPDKVFFDVLKVDIREDGSDKGITEHFRDRVMTGHCLVGWNSRRFDIPVLAHRSFVHAVPAGWYYDNSDMRNRYKLNRHWDLSDFLSNHGAHDNFHLSEMTKTIGLPGKFGMHGGEVAAAWARGEYDRVSDYCMTDVIQTLFVMLRILLAQERITMVNYSAVSKMAVHQLRQIYADRPYILELFEKTDLNRLIAPWAVPAK